MSKKLETSSNDWYKFNEKADKIQRKHSDARTSEEKKMGKKSRRIDRFHAFEIRL